MPRSFGAQLSGRPGLAGSALLLTILGLLPTPSTRWLDGLHNPVLTVLAPVQSSVRSLVVWIRPSALGVARHEEIEGLIASIEGLNAQLLSARSEVEDLRTRLREVSRAIDLNPTLPVKTIIAPIIGPGADLSGGTHTVKAGQREGVDPGSVVTVRGVYLYGRVKHVTDRTCEVLPITYKPTKGAIKEGETVSAVVMLSEQGIGPRCDISPVGDGTLKGKLQGDYDPNDPNYIPPKPGMMVRLVDPRWPESSRMLIIGAIDRIDPAPDAPLRQIVTVRPIYSLDRWSEVMIRIPDPAAGAGRGKP